MIKVLIAALILLGVLFVALLWFVAVLAKLSLWIPGGITALIVVSLAATWIIRTLLARRAADGLEKAMAGQAQNQAQLTRPDLQPQLQKMQRDFENAVSSLKSSRLGKQGRDAMYALPWYAIIGPPGAGKSTALRQSGLQFPSMSGSGAAAVKGVGGTRNCDWWLTNDAVLLDTAGRWSTQEEDHDEWLSFLGLLKRFRSKKPLNGLITAVSIGDVVNSSPDEIDALATRMRERIDEAMSELKVSIPVYVLFTKCDLIEGFVETFRPLSRNERSQVWGFTRPLASNTGEVAATFEEELEGMAKALDCRAHAHILDERNIEARHRIYAFPQQFAVMRRNLARFAETLFVDNIYKESPVLRGAYFSSGTQEGRPFSLLMNRLAGAVGAEKRLPDEGAAVDQKSYFLRDLFLGVIFPDRDIASASESELRRKRRVRLAMAGGLFLVALSVGILPSYAWYKNNALLSGVDDIINGWESGATARLNPVPKTTPSNDSENAAAQIVHRLAPLRHVTERLNLHQEDGVPFSMGLGMYQGSQLLPQLSRYYATLVRRELVAPTIQQGAKQMTDFGYRYSSLPYAKPSEQEHRSLYDVLKLHLLLTGPKAPSEPNVAQYDDWIASELANSWRGESDDPGLEKAAALSASLYTRSVASTSDLNFPRDRTVIGRVRDALNRVSSSQRALQRIISSVEPDGFEQTLHTLVGRVGVVRAEGRIRGAFTRRGWESKVRAMLSPQQLDHSGEQWVLSRLEDGTEQVAQTEAELAELASSYFRAYVQEWQEFLRTTHIPQPPGKGQALDVLRELSRGHPPPLALLLQRVHYNTTLEPTPTASTTDAANGALAKLGDKLVKMLPQAAKDAKRSRKKRPGYGRKLLTHKDVAAAFEGLTSFAVPPSVEGGGPVPAVPYDVYHEQLFYVRDALQTLADDPDEADDVLAKLQSARTRVRALIDEQPDGWRPLFNNLLWPPVEGAAVSSNAAAASAKGASWCRAVFSPFNNGLKGRYPFSKNGQDIPLSDFAAFYAPDEGAVSAFAKDVLGSTVKEDGGRFTFSKKLGRDASSVYSPELLNFLERSHDVGRSFFTEGSEPKMRFEIRIHPSPWVATTDFRIGGQEIEYHNGPEQWRALVWPGPSPEMGATIEVRGANGMHERLQQSGEWGLFRLIESGTIVASTHRMLTVAWELRTHDVTIKMDLKAVRSASPFFGVQRSSSHPPFLQPVRDRGLQAPRKIVHTARPCSAR